MGWLPQQSLGPGQRLLLYHFCAAPPAVDSSINEQSAPSIHMHTGVLPCIPLLRAQGFRELYDPILAYKFIYPVVTSEGQQLQMTLTHPPEKVRGSSCRACLVVSCFQEAQ